MPDTIEKFEVKTDNLTYQIIYEKPEGEGWEPTYRVECIRGENQGNLLVTSPLDIAKGSIDTLFLKDGKKNPQVENHQVTLKENTTPEAFSNEISNNEKKIKNALEKHEKNSLNSIAATFRRNDLKHLETESKVIVIFLESLKNNLNKSSRGKNLGNIQERYFKPGKTFEKWTSGNQEDKELIALAHYATSQSINTTILNRLSDPMYFSCYMNHIIEKEIKSLEPEKKKSKQELINKISNRIEEKKKNKKEETHEGKQSNREAFGLFAIFKSKMPQPIADFFSSIYFDMSFTKNKKQERKNSESFGSGILKQIREKISSFTLFGKSNQSTQTGDETSIPTPKSI